MIRVLVALTCLLPAAQVSGQTADAPPLPETGFDCIARPNAVTELTSQEQGVLTEILVDQGDTVSRGQVVARLDSDLQESAVTLARIRAENQSAIAAGKARLKYRQTEFDRMSELLDRSATSQAQLDEAAVELELARSELETARADHRVAEAELEQAKLRLERRKVIAPFDAVVVEVTASRGEYAHEEAPVMTLAQLDPLRVEAYLPIRYTEDVAPGQQAEVVFPKPIDVRRPATVASTDKVFDASSRTFGVRLDLPNPDLELPGEIRCRLRFDGASGG